MIPYGQHFIDEDDIGAVVKILRSGSLTQGPAVEEFENLVSNYVGAKYAVAVSSGTAALHLAVLASGIEVGSKLITSSISFVASANAGRYVGAEIIFADIDPETINISEQSLIEAFENHQNIKAVIPVHFSGLPCEMDKIKKIADQNDALVIEDAAHALGATYDDGQKVGCCAHSLMTIFSFHP